MENKFHIIVTDTRAESKTNPDGVVSIRTITPVMSPASIKNIQLALREIRNGTKELKIIVAG